MENHEFLQDGVDAETCPVHNAESKKEYDFGQYSDATVTVYHGCKCAVCTKHNDILSDATYHTSYSSAAGRATLIVERFNVKYG